MGLCPKDNVIKTTAMTTINNSFSVILHQTPLSRKIIATPTTTTALEEEDEVVVVFVEEKGGYLTPLNK